MYVSVCACVCLRENAGVSKVVVVNINTNAVMTNFDTDDGWWSPNTADDWKQTGGKLAAKNSGYRIIV